MRAAVTCPKCGEELVLIPQEDEDRLLLLYALLSPDTRVHLLRYAESLVIVEQGRNKGLMP